MYNNNVVEEESSPPSSSPTCKDEGPIQSSPVDLIGRNISVGGPSCDGLTPPPCRILGVDSGRRTVAWMDVGEDQPKLHLIFARRPTRPVAPSCRWVHVVRRPSPPGGGDQTPRTRHGMIPTVSPSPRRVGWWAGRSFPRRWPSMGGSPWSGRTGRRRRVGGSPPSGPGPQRPRRSAGRSRRCRDG
jgi:hypothetical protein